MRFHGIQFAASMPIFFHQQITNSNCKYIKAVQKAFVQNVGEMEHWQPGFIKIACVKPGMHQYTARGPNMAHGSL